MPKLPDDDDDYRAGRGSSDPEADAEDVPGLAGSAAPKAPLGWAVPDRAWLTTAPPPRRFLVDHVRTGPGGQELDRAGFLPMGEVCLLAAAGASGKTWLAVALALAVVARRPWLAGDGHTSPLRTTGQPGRVALVLAEDRADEIRRRIQAQVKLERIRPEDLADGLVILTREGMADDPALVKEDRTGSGVYGPTPFGAQLRADLEGLGTTGRGWALIVLDPLSAFGPPAAELDNAAATATIRAIEGFTGLPGGPAVLLTHHTRKRSADARDKGPPGAEDIRGASGLVNRARWAMVGEAAGETSGGAARLSRWEVVKYNYGPPMPAIRVSQPREANGAARLAHENETPDGGAAPKAAPRSPSGGGKGSKPTTPDPYVDLKR